MSDQIAPTTPGPTQSLVTETATLSDGSAASLTERIEAVLLKAAHSDGSGRKSRIASLNLDLAALARPGDRVEARAWIERSTRTLIFMMAEVRRSDDGALLAAAGAILRIVD